MSDNCKYERRFAEVEREVAVTDKRVDGLGQHVEDIADSVRQMQKWIMGFVISVMLMVTLSIIKHHMDLGKAIAYTHPKEIVKNGK